MPGRWESSRRPLFVRTVWIKGIRHVVLSKNDPLLQRAMQDIPLPTSPLLTTSESTTASSPTSVSSMTSDYLSTFTSSSIETLPEPNLSERLNKQTKEQNARQEEKTALDGKEPSDDRKLLSHVKKCDKDGATKNRRLLLPIDDPASVDQNMAANRIRFDQNPLSDRVMKWLDLSGKSLLETTMVSEKSDSEKSRQDMKRSRGEKHIRKYMKHRSASLNIINAQYDMTLTADIRIEGNPQQQSQMVRFQDAKSERKMSTRTNRIYELKRSNSVIPLPVSLDGGVETVRPTTTEGAISTKTKLHIFVPLIRESDSLSEDSEEYF